MSSFILHCHLQCWDFQFLHTKPTFVIVFLFNYSHPSECKISYCSLIFISLMSNIEHLFMYLMHIYLFFFKKCLCESFADFLLVYLSFYCWVEEFFILFSILLLYQILNLQIFSAILWVVFSLVKSIYSFCLFTLDISSWVHFNSLTFLKIWQSRNLICWHVIICIISLYIFLKVL